MWKSKKAATDGSYHNKNAPRNSAECRVWIMGAIEKKISCCNSFATSGIFLKTTCSFFFVFFTLQKVQIWFRNAITFSTINGFQCNNSGLKAVSFFNIMYSGGKQIGKLKQVWHQALSLFIHCWKRSAWYTLQGWIADPYRGSTERTGCWGE